jgi:hypothetical protein
MLYICEGSRTLRILESVIAYSTFVSDVHWKRKAVMIIPKAFLLQLASIVGKETKHLFATLITVP